MRDQDHHYREDVIGQPYPFQVSVDEDGGYVIEFPDLPGCVTQVETLHEIPGAADEIRTLWIETALDHGNTVPPPSVPPTYSGKFNVRLPRSLHRSLAESAAREGVSLNQHVVAILAGGSGNAEIERKLDRIEGMLQSGNESAPHSVDIAPEPSLTTR